MARRSKADAEKTRQDILDAASALFEEQGYADASLNEIVERAGITKGALFHHFENKEALFREVWESLQIAMDADARKAAIEARSKTDPYAAFLAGCRVYLKWAAKPGYQRIVLVDGPSVMGAGGWFEADHKLGNDNVRGGVNYLAKQGLIAPERAAAVAVLLQNALNGAGFALSRGQPDVDVDSLFETYEILLRGAR